MIKPPPCKSFFLFGPRGTGKTTWVKSAFPRALYIDLLDSAVFIELLANPNRLEGMIPPGFSEHVIIDEVQRVPELLNEIHRLIESRRLCFVLTGSSPRKLRRHGHNLLAGRALTYTMHPLTAAELGEDFDLRHSLRHGHLPSACTESEPKKYLESYVRTYLEQEIFQEGLTRNLAGFTRFLEMASFSQGSILNIASIGRDASIERKTAEQYFKVLEDLLIGYRLPAFTKRARRKISIHPKFYFFDAGVFRTIRPKGPLDASEEVDGIALETLVFQELLAVNDLLDFGYHIFFWRTIDQREVDFVMYGERGLIAIEVKRSANIAGTQLRALSAFLKDYPEAKAYCFYGGARRRYEENIMIIPVTEALLELPKLLAL